MKTKLTLFTVLLLPTLVYVYFALGVPKAFRAPFFGPRHTIEVKDKNGNPKIDTAYFTIPEFQCKTVGGTMFSSTSLNKHLYIAVFVDPDSAATIMKLLAQDILWNRSKYANARFAFFYPGDSLGNPPVKAPDFAADLKLGTDTAWTLFLSPATFDSLNSNYYFVPDPSRKKDPWNGKRDAVLIDRKGRIRGYYNIRMGDQLKKMKEDVNFIHFRDEAAETIESTSIKKGE